MVKEPESVKRLAHLSRYSVGVAAWRAERMQFDTRTRTLLRETSNAAT
jgi:hypothetical protein